MKTKLSPTRDSDGDDGSEGHADGLLALTEATPPRSLTRRQLEKLVADRSQRFDALTPAERRMAIARDVLAQLRAGRFTPEAGTYVISNMPGVDVWSPDAQLVVDTPGMECSVCAIGSALVSSAQLFNRLPSKTSLVDLARFDLRRNYLDDFFSREQQALIETAFECNPGYCEQQGGIDPEDARRALRFGERYDTKIKRMRGIWFNALRNGGEFIP